MGIKELGCEGVEWIILVQIRKKWRRVVNTEVNLRFLQNEGTFCASRRTISILIRAYLCGVIWL